MTIERFEDILVWQKARVLVQFVYSLLKDCKDYSFKDQMQRAALSVMNNIAEGFERRGDKQFKNFLYISKSSCAEVRSMLYIALDSGYCNKSQFTQGYAMCIEISKMIAGLIRTLKI